MSQEFAGNFIETLSVGQKNLINGVINLDIPDLEISWDFDQVLVRSEIPVADFCDMDLKTHYAGRRIRGWNSFSKWLLDDGVFKTKEESDAYEEMIWTDPKILKEAPPNKRLQALSFKASQLGIRQTITTSRIPALAKTTECQVKLHFPWLIGHVNQREVAVAWESGEDYKVAKVSEMYSKNPNVVHLDDSMSFVRKIIKIAPGIDIIGFPCVEDDTIGFENGRRVFFPDISVLTEMISYPEV